VSQGFEEKYKNAPNQRKKELRPDQGQDQEDEASDYKGNIPTSRNGEGSQSRFLEKAVGIQKLHGLKEPREHSSVAHRISNPALEHVFRHHDVVPIVENNVEELKDEPETD
jgi:hypothetical protein